MPAWETACQPYPGQTDARLRLGSGVSLSAITGCSFNLSLTRCIKNNGQQKWHPATSCSQPDSDTPTSYLSQVFVLKNPALRTTSLGWLPSLPRLASLSPMSPSSLPWLYFLSYSLLINPAPWLTASVWFLQWLRPNSDQPKRTVRF